MAGITEKYLEVLKPEVEVLVPVNNTESEFDNVMQCFPVVETSDEVNDTKRHVEIESDKETMDKDIPEDEIFLPLEYKGRTVKNLDLVNPSLDDLLIYATDDKPYSSVFDPKHRINPDRFKLIQRFKSDKSVDLKGKGRQNKAVANGPIQKRASREKKYRIISRVRHNQLIFRIGHLARENMMLYNRLKNLVLKQHKFTMNMATNGTATRVEEAGVEEFSANSGFLDMPDINPYPMEKDVKVSPWIDVEAESIKIEKNEETLELNLNEDPMNYSEGDVPYANFHYTLVQE